MRQKRRERGEAERAAAASLSSLAVAEAQAEAFADALAEQETVAAPEADPEVETDAQPETEQIELDSARLKSLVEAIVFASDKPVTFVRLKQLTRIKDAARIQGALDELTADYKDRGIALQCISGGYMFRTQSQFSSWVQQLVAGRPVRLSRAQLETLAIIAYRQPISRGEIEEIRGVAAGSMLKSLHERGLIDVVGRAEGLGRPLLYGTTPVFLEHFALRHLEELPRADELAIALRTPERHAEEPVAAAEASE
jgi:segregation and condensation protein B